MKILIVTPTIGDPELVDALISVRAQTFSELADVEIRHVVIVDGEEYQREVIDAITVAQASYTPETFVDTRMVIWPFNTGGQGFYGHKIYAAVSQLVTPDIDWVLFLDQDNWYEPNHIESLVLKASQEGLDYSYCLRKYYTHDRKFFANDNCLSLGPYKAWENELGGRNLIDTGCYCFRGDYISKLGHYWNMGWGADVTFFERTMSTARYAGTAERTFCYRMGDLWSEKFKEQSEFVLKWNEYAKKRYDGDYPWER